MAILQTITDLSREFGTERYVQAGDYTSRLVLMEDMKSMPFGAVWSEYCERNGVPNDGEWMKEVKQYEKDVLSKRGEYRVILESNVRNRLHY